MIDGAVGDSEILKLKSQVVIGQEVCIKAELHGHAGTL